MIELYFWPTPNGTKIAIALEELGLDYEVEYVNITKGDQFKPEYLKLNPNNKMPTIVDRDPPGGGAPLPVFESGAILLYLAEKSGRLLPSELRSRYEVIQWLVWQVAGQGPMLGQVHHFLNYAPERVPYAIDRYTAEAERLYGVLDRQLQGREHICGEYSIADIACWPWVVPYERQGLDLEQFPNVRRWFEAVGERPAVQRGYAVGDEHRASPGKLDEKARKVLFGKGRG